VCILKECLHIEIGEDCCKGGMSVVKRFHTTSTVDHFFAVFLYADFA
jgi:hypothetical protein